MTIVISSLSYIISLIEENGGRLTHRRKCVTLTVQCECIIDLTWHDVDVTISVIRAEVIHACTACSNPAGGHPLFNKLFLLYKTLPSEMGVRKRAITCRCPVLHDPDSLNTLSCAVSKRQTQ